ncbi:MAG TPA: hypothetical protein VL625_00970 [Patescibacteria group bacterium]|nr:hypothetical protein [Patescibacteria group bacterium]
MILSVAPFIEALNKSDFVVLFTRDVIGVEDQKAIPGIVTDCLGHIEGVKVLPPHEGVSSYTITVSATSFRKRFFVVAQATDAQGVLKALQAEYLDLEELKKKMCSVIIHPLAEKLLHPPPETAESAESLQMLVEGIGYVNTGFYETAYVRLYRVLMDHPQNADALYWLAEGLAGEHPSLAEVHAREFIAAFPKDPRGAKLAALLNDHAAQEDHRQ